MKSYYINLNPQSNGDYEVHSQSCSFLPEVNNRKYLGDFENCKSAVVHAKSNYASTRINGCKFCSEPCHTS